MADPTPLAYWGGGAIDWKTIAALFTAMGIPIGAAYPFFKAWWERRDNVTMSAAKAAETNQDRLDRVAREQYDNALKERERAEAREKALRDENEALARDRDDGWDLARAMEEFAHTQRHAHVNTGFNFNTLLTFFGRLVDGSLSQDQARHIVEKTSMEPEPPRVPPLRSLTGIKPP